MQPCSVIVFFIELADRSLQTFLKKSFQDFILEDVDLEVGIHKTTFFGTACSLFFHITSGFSGVEIFTGERNKL